MKKAFYFMIAVSSILTALHACGSAKSDSDSSEQPSNDLGGTPGDFAKGGDIYKRTCIGCHQANGEGITNTFPPLAKSDFLGDKDVVIHQIIHGKSGEMVVNGITYNNIMPPQPLTDEEVAAVLTYVYGSWGNTPATFTAEQVSKIRNKAS